MSSINKKKIQRKKSVLDRPYTGESHEIVIFASLHIVWPQNIIMILLIPLIPVILWVMLMLINSYYNINHCIQIHDWIGIHVNKFSFEVIQWAVTQQEICKIVQNFFSSHCIRSYIFWISSRPKAKRLSRNLAYCCCQYAVTLEHLKNSVNKQIRLKKANKGDSSPGL